jgi:hypothetical protein
MRRIKAHLHHAEYWIMDYVQWHTAAAVFVGLLSFRNTHAGNRLSVPILRSAG